LEISQQEKHEKSKIDVSMTPNDYGWQPNSRLIAMLERPGFIPALRISLQYDNRSSTSARHESTLYIAVDEPPPSNESRSSSTCRQQDVLSVSY